MTDTIEDRADSLVRRLFAFDASVVILREDVELALAALQVERADMREKAAKVAEIRRNPETGNSVEKHPSAIVQEIRNLD